MKLSLADGAALAGLVFAALVAGSGGACASSVTLPEASYLATVQFSHGNSGGDGSATFNTLGSHKVVDPSYSSTVVTFKDHPSPSVYGSMVINSVAPDTQASAAIFVDLVYYFTLDGPENVLVPVQIEGAAGYKVNAHGGGATVSFADASLSVTDLADHPLVIGPTTIAQVAYQDPTGPQDLTYSESYGAVAGHLYSLDLGVEIAAGTYGSGGGAGLSAAAWIDPVLSISTPGYHLLVSTNVGNTFAATPIPAALPLFASALGGLGFVGWKRRRHATA